MDHLVLPTDASRPLLRVPFVWKCNYPLGQIPFSEYPVYFMKQLADDHQDWAADKDEVLRTLVQNWLYFGVLHEVFGDSVRPELFKSRDSEFGDVLYTKPLQSLRQSWAADQAFIKDPHSMNDRNIKILSAAVQACELLEDEVENGDLVVQHLKTILLSVKILLCSLSSMILAVVEYSPLKSDATTLLQRLTFARYSLDQARLQGEFPFYQHMLENHWCPLQIQYILSTSAITTVCYFACMKRRQRSGIPSHRACLDEEFCVAYSLGSQTDGNSSEAQFKLHHTTPNCPCTEVLTVPELTIVEMIEAGDIPVINFEIPNSGGPVEFTISPLEKGSKYTAISHVWADGLGNPEMNALAVCQVKQLISRIKTMQHPASRGKKMWLWIDAFSIPNVPKNDGTLDSDSQRRRLRAMKAKNKAIGMMTAIYAGAEFVLALDSEMESFSTQAMCLAELTARCFVCGWKGRAWTMQEGSLATHLGVQLADGFVFAKEMQMRYDEAIKTAYWNRSFDEQIQLLQDCRQAWFLPSVGNHCADRANNMSARDVQLMEVWNNLIGKSTTKPDDFYQIVANLLDFQTDWVRRYDSVTNSRLEVKHVAVESMILYQDRIPMDLLCLPQIATNIMGPNSNFDAEYRAPNRLSLKPRGPQLTARNFGKCFYRDNSSADEFRLERSSGVVAYKFNVASNLPTVFCVRSGVSSEWKSTFHFQLSLPLRLRPGHMGDQSTVVLYFSSTSRSRLLRDTSRTGACFVVTSSATQVARERTSLKIRYLCSFTYKPCQDRKCQRGMPQSVFIFPVTFHEYSQGISFDLGMQLVVNAVLITRGNLAIGRAWPNPGRRQFLNLRGVMRKGSSKNAVNAFYGFMTTLSLGFVPMGLFFYAPAMIVTSLLTMYFICKWRLSHYIRFEHRYEQGQLGFLTLKVSYYFVKTVQDSTEGVFQKLKGIREWILYRSEPLRWETGQSNIRNDINFARLPKRLPAITVLKHLFQRQKHETPDECLVSIPVERAPTWDTDVFEPFGAAIADIFLYLRDLLAEPVARGPGNDSP